MDAWRQWIRHRTANVNEYSTRYSIAIDAAQKTRPDEWRLQSEVNKQGSCGFLSENEGQSLSIGEAEFQRNARLVYEARLAAGVARDRREKICRYLHTRKRTGRSISTIYYTFSIFEWTPTLSMRSDHTL